MKCNSSEALHLENAISSITFYDIKAPVLVRYARSVRD